MSTSKKQTKANQENAQKSTGPVTDEGKKTSSQNATRHGLNSVNIIINSPHLKEDQSEYDLLVAALIDELEPKSTLQLHFVYKIANCHWRYRRLINAETAQINRQLHPVTSPLLHSDLWHKELKNSGLLENYLNSASIPIGDAANTLSRYEWRLNRELHHAYKMLRELQAFENRSNNKKSQNEPISPQSHTPQQPPAPPQTAEHIDRVFDPIQNDQPLPPDPEKINPMDGFLSALEQKYGPK